MRLKNALPTQTLPIVVFIGLILFWGLNFIFKSGKEKDSSQLIANAAFLYGQEKENLPSPTRIRIPKINIDASIEYVGLTSDGAMDVPKGPSNAAWFDLGTRPGNAGSAVIDGHSGWKNGIPAVFDNLYKLQKGDKIYVEDSKGVITTFVVRESRKYNPNADAKDVFVSNDTKAHLNLITCAGFWNKIWKSHSDRLVVFTDKEL